MCFLSPYLRARFGRGERGASLVEYLLLVTLIAMVCLGAVAWFGGSNAAKISDVGSRIS